MKTINTTRLSTKTEIGLLSFSASLLWFLPLWHVFFCFSFLYSICLLSVTVYVLFNLLFFSVFISVDLLLCKIWADFFNIKDPFYHCVSIRNQAIRGRLDLLCSAQTLQWHEGIPEILRNVVLTQAENETAEDLWALLCGVLTIKITLGKTTFKAALKSGWLSVCTGRRHFSIRFCKNQNFFWKIIVWFLSLFIYLTSDREIDAQWG